MANRLTATAFAALTAFAAPAALAQQAPEWTVDPDQSRVGFIAQQSGNDVPGEFERFQTTIRFEVCGQPPGLSVDVKIDNSVVTGSTGPRPDDQVVQPVPRGKVPERPLRGGQLPPRGRRHLGSPRAMAEYDARHHPPGSWLPFELEVDGDTVGRGRRPVTVKRLRWGIGQGQWQDTSMVPERGGDRDRHPRQERILAVVVGVVVAQATPGRRSPGWSRSASLYPPHILCWV